MLKRFIFTFIFLLIASTAWAAHPIASAQATDTGMIRVTLNDGTVQHVPDNMANSHRQQLAEWVAEGNTITPADPWAATLAEAKLKKDRIARREGARLFRAYRDSDLSLTTADLGNYKAALVADYQTAKTAVLALAAVDEVRGYVITWTPVPN